MTKWKKIYPDTDTLPHIKESDKCGHLMEYIKGGGYKASKTNDLILNFKKSYYNSDGEKKSSIELGHKEEAIRKFADDLYELLKNSPQEKLVNISFIPTSKSKQDPEYDDRFKLVCKKLSERFKGDTRFLFKNPIEILNSRVQSSRTNEFRGEEYIQKLKNNFSWVWSHSKRPDIFLVLDDVINTGAQFRAYSGFVLENMQNPPQIIGLFWAKAVEKASSNEDVSDF